MDRWKGRVALVTGASAGIGASIAKKLVQTGMQVVGVARRVERIQEMADELADATGKLHAIKCDIRNESDILATFKWIHDNLGGTDVLVNNAGVLGDSSLTTSGTEEWRFQVDVNIIGLSIFTREAIQSMRRRGVDDGHIIHISSVFAHMYPDHHEFSMYAATKHAVKALAEGLRTELGRSNSHIRITCISPGLVDSEILDNCSKFSREGRVLPNPHLHGDDVADSVVYVLSAPPNVQIFDLIIEPVGNKDYNEEVGQPGTTFLH